MKTKLCNVHVSNVRVLIIIGENELNFISKDSYSCNFKDDVNTS